MSEKNRAGDEQQDAVDAGKGGATKGPLPWFRVYHEIIDDDKLGLLAFEDRWHYVALLACKRRGLLDKADKPELMMRRIALKLGLSVAALDEVARRLAEVGLIERVTLQPLAWESRQMRSDTDPTAADRKRKQREKSKVTGVSRVTGTDVTGTEEEEDTDTEGAKSSPADAGEQGEGGGNQDDGAGNGKPPKKRKGAKEYSEAFEEAWALYPKRLGGNSKADAFAAWTARIRAGVKPEAMKAGVVSYAKHVRSEGKEHTVFVKQGATFFGPGEHWSADYGPAGNTGTGTGNTATGRTVAANSQQRSFQNTQYGDSDIPSWLEEEAEART